MTVVRCCGGRRGRRKPPLLHDSKVERERGEECVTSKTGYRGSRVPQISLSTFFSSFSSPHFLKNLGFFVWFFLNFGEEFFVID